MIQIEKDVPLPPKLMGRQGRPSLYPFADMEVGDSFLVVEKAAPAVRTAMHRFSKQRPNREFTCRSVTGGVRVWRVK